MSVLYVEIVNPGPVIFLGERATRRVVKVPLTQEQEELIAPKKVGVSEGKDVYEEFPRPLSIQSK